MPTTLKTGSTVNTPNSGTTPGVAITAGPGSASNQGTLFVSDHASAPIFTVSSVSAYVWGDRFPIYNSGSSSWVGFRSDTINGYTFTIGVVNFPDGTTNQGMNLRAGTGVPSASTISGWAELGDVYHRRDGSGGTRIYICTAAGSPGTWTAVK